MLPLRHPFPEDRARVHRSEYLFLDEREFVTAMYGGGTNVESNSEERPSLLDTYINAKFLMTWGGVSGSAKTTASKIGRDWGR